MIRGAQCKFPVFRANAIKGRIVTTKLFEKGLSKSYAGCEQRLKSHCSSVEVRNFRQEPIFAFSTVKKSCRCQGKFISVSCIFVKRHKITVNNVTRRVRAQPG